MIDEEFPGRIMLAEANQWPEDVVHYFGTEEEPECHMCFHFPVMPRIYYAIRDQRATQIVDILADTPPIPARRPVEHVPAQPRRAHARDGLHRGARVDVRLVRARLADARQRRHPPPAGPAAGQLPQGDRARARAAAVPARAARACTTATRSAWATTSGCPTATRSAPRCSGRRTATPGFSTADPGKLYLPRRPVAGAPLQPHQRRGPARAADVAAALGARHAHGPPPAPGARAPASSRSLPCDNDVGARVPAAHRRRDDARAWPTSPSTARAATVHAARPRRAGRCTTCSAGRRSPSVGADGDRVVHARLARLLLAGADRPVSLTARTVPRRRAPARRAAGLAARRAAGSRPRAQARGAVGGRRRSALARRT